MHSSAAPATAARPAWSPGLWVIAVLPCVKLLVHCATNLAGGYGYFRDELYYLACSDHLALGYVDQPPLSIYVLALTRRLLGDSLFAIRLPAALAGAATALLSGLMARELGGGRFSQVLAGTASTTSLIFLAMNSYYSMNSLDILIWALAGATVIRLIRTGDPRRWLLLGLILGLGLLNKIGVLWLGFGIFAGLVATPHRAWLKTRWPWLGGWIAAVLFLPYIAWNVTHDMAMLEFIRNATSGKYSSLSPATFLVDQVLQQNPVAFPLWLAGLYFYLISKEGAEYRIVGYTYLIALAILLLNGHTKGEYLSPAYSMLFAAGSVLFERRASSWRAGWVKPLYAGLLISAGLLLAPAATPILPVEAYLRYARALGIQPSTAEGKQLGELPQFYADMFGWEEKAQAVAKVYTALSPEDQARCAIYADNYGRCAAIDFFGRKAGLPPCIGRHNNYWIWGPRRYTGELMILLGGDLKSQQELFEKVEVAGYAPCERCMPYEKDLPVSVGRNLKIPLKELWPRLKTYD